MEKEIRRKIEKVEIQHDFYCDECGKRVFSSIEYDDGYYDEPEEEIFYKIIIENDWYFYKKCLCEECKEKHIKELINELKKIGFKEEVE